MCIRDRYSTRILDALPDMLTVFDHDANIIELASSPSTNHVEGINADKMCIRDSFKRSYIPAVCTSKYMNTADKDRKKNPRAKKMCIRDRLKHRTNRRTIRM